MFKPKTPISAIFASPKGSVERDGRLRNSSGEWICLPLRPVEGTTGSCAMSQNPESVPFVRRALQTLAPAASAGVSRPDVRLVVFLAFLHSSFQFNIFKFIFSWGMRPP